MTMTIHGRHETWSSIFLRNKCITIKFCQCYQIDVSGAHLSVMNITVRAIGAVYQEVVCDADWNILNNRIRNSTEASRKQRDLV